MSRAGWGGGFGCDASAGIIPAAAAKARIALLNFLAEEGEMHCVSSPALARVVELVDTQVSEACALTAWEFESPLGHHRRDRLSKSA